MSEEILDIFTRDGKKNWPPFYSDEFVGYEKTYKDLVIRKFTEILL